MTKLCQICNLEKDEKEFNSNYSTTYLNACKSCKSDIKSKAVKAVRESKTKAREYSRKYNLENEQKIKLQARKAWLKRMYNITPEQYDEMLKKQNGVCAICERPESQLSIKGSVKALAVDHNHETGKIRGLLCYRCNRHFVGIGNKDNIELLRQNIMAMEKAIKYIETDITSVSLT